MTNDFADLFYHYRKDRSDQARHYLYGLIQGGHSKTIEHMSSIVPESNYQALQQFISDSGWRYQEVMNRVCEKANELIGDEKDTCLLVDESGFRKKGKLSVGVARQYLGNIGKVDSGQVGVFLALCKGSHSTLVNGRLYLPKEWTQDKFRCERAKIPHDDRVFSTKEMIAVDLILQARALGAKYGWVGADAGYGKGMSFCECLDCEGETFVVDIHSDFRIYEKNPHPYVPSGSGRGRKPTRHKTDAQPLRVDEWVVQQPDNQWVKVKLREATKGPLEYEVLSKRLWVLSPDTGRAYHWHIIVRRNVDTHDEVKYSISNAPSDTTIERLAYMQGQRYWIERSFEDSKGECGMKDYEVRSWAGWHHHMALVMMVQLFMLKEKVDSVKEHPLLSAPDIGEILDFFLPRKPLTEEELFAKILKRHQVRQDLIDAANRRHRFYAKYRQN